MRVGAGSKSIGTFEKLSGHLPEAGKSNVDLCGNGSQQEAKEAQEELQQMVISLKNIAKQKLESGETAAAKAILSQVQQYAPDDDEIKTLLHNLEEEVQ